MDGNSKNGAQGNGAQGNGNSASGPALSGGEPGEQPAQGGIVARARGTGPLLSICIPTYKRGYHVERLVRGILVTLLSDPRYDIEVIAVNNKSPDDTRERLEKIHHPRFRAVHREVHLDSAEENIFHSLPFATGEYVWFLGDDDLIHHSNFPTVYGLLEAGVHDLLVFNSALLAPGGEVVRLQTMPMNGPAIESDVPALVESIGLLYTFAGVSNVIQRRSRLDLESGLEWLRISKIYSHVAWMVDRHKDSRAVFVNAPLVFYRQNDYSTGHWERVAERFNVPNLYFWSLGIVRLLANLVARQAISFRTAGLIFELAGDSTRYRLLDDILFKTFQQIELWVQTGDDRQKFSKQDLYEILEFAELADNTTFDICKSLREAAETIFSDVYKSKRGELFAGLQDTFMRQYVERQRPGQFFTRFSGRIHGYDVYRMPFSYVAVRWQDTAVRERVLRVVDPQTEGVSVLVGKDIHEVARLAQIAAAKMSDHGEMADLLTTTGRDQAAQSGPEMRQNVNHLSQSLGEQSRLALALTNQVQNLTQQVDAIHASTSWSITGPLRVVGRLVGRRGRRQESVARSS